MSVEIILILAAAAVLVFWAVSTYNFFVSSKARIKAAKEEIGNQLKRQAELIPNLESSAKGFLKQEKAIFEALTSARKAVAKAVKSGDLQEMSDAGAQLAQVIPQISIAVEDNPEIKSDKVVTRLMEELRDTSDKVMFSRRLLIDLVADYNVRRVSVPSRFIASMFSFEELEGLKAPKEGEHLEVSSSDIRAPKVNL